MPLPRLQWYIQALIQYCQDAASNANCRVFVFVFVCVCVHVCMCGAFPKMTQSLPSISVSPQKTPIAGFL